MASNATFPPLPPHIATKTGPRLLGFLFHWGLFGVLSVQVYLYNIAFPRDYTRNKVMVYSVYVLEVVQTGFMTASAYSVFGTGYGNFSVFDKVQLAWFSVPVISGVVAFIAQAFYAYRISVLSRSRWVPGIIILLALVQLGGSIAWAIIFKQAGLFSRLQVGHYPIFIGIWNGGSALCDVIIAVYMTYYLSVARRTAGTVKSTDVVLKRVIKLVIETGTITAAVAILNLILISLPSHTSYYLVPSESLAKIYSNSMMVVLNSRIRIGAERPVSLAPTNMALSRRGVGAMSEGNAEAGVGIDAYTLSRGVLVTREQVVFPSGSERNLGKNNNSGSGSVSDDLKESPEFGEVALAY
ncbi:hypothetical protein GALMADRAFT_139610 [Galerina marginata CBS 339.88]|uniref:DUF6534 domain-containing protein n=1 Tax=Galerina marginata (strain CBS 339.88) TaxID=685588 RepID=A0A067T0P2_GALM3|nr:hypothetical protein GALMADRAFT_139610 [Galerina marginata CBS 339.88]